MTRPPALVSAGLLTSALTAGALLTAPAQAADRTGSVATSSRTVELRVQSTNRTSVPCSGAADGRTVRVSGTLVGPAKDVGASRVGRVNVLVHDISTAGWFWSLPGQPRVDHAARLADRGETSLVLDRFGYGASERSRGTDTCLGAQADMLHQVVGQLRRGGSGLPVARQVVTHGHAVGAAITQLEAATWKDVDALVSMSWTPLGVSADAVAKSARQHTACLLGTDRGVPPGHAWFGATAQEFEGMHFASASRAVRAAAVARRTADPCGDALSLAQTVALGVATDRAIDVPVLSLFGDRDVLNRPDSATLAQSASPDVTVRVIAGDGGALPLEAGAPRTRAIILDWLAALPR